MTITEIRNEISTFNNTVFMHAEINDTFVNVVFGATKFAAAGVENLFEETFFMFNENKPGTYCMTFLATEIEF